MSTDVNGLEELETRIEQAKKLMEWNSDRFGEPTLLEYLRYWKSGTFGEVHILAVIEALIKSEQNKLLDRVLEQKQFIACLDTNEDHNVVPIEAIKTLREGL